MSSGRSIQLYHRLYSRDKNNKGYCLSNSIPQRYKNINDNPRLKNYPNKNANPKVANEWLYADLRDASRRLYCIFRTKGPTLSTLVMIGRKLGVLNVILIKINSFNNFLNRRMHLVEEIYPSKFLD